MAVSDEESIIEWFNTFAITTDNAEKVILFHKIQEILLRKSPNLLTKYLNNVLNFTTDKSQDIKKALVGFIEELCKVRESFLPKVMMHLHMLLCDQSVVVQKRVIQATITIYRKTLAWLCKSSNISEELEEAWKQLNTIKLQIANLIDNDNDGIRTSAVKFLECVILLQTYPDETENKRQNDFSLDDVPLTLKIARRRKLEEEASNLFELVVKFHGSPHISSANLLTCIGVLTNLAKCRAEFMIRVVSALETLYNNLPPTLSTTQVNSVRKKLKSELCGLLKHPAAYEYLDKITPMLIELGSSQSEINKLIPKSDERKKYNKRTLSAESSVQQTIKKPRLEPIFNYENDPYDDIPLTPLEVNEQYIMDNLSLEKAVYLICVNIIKLPNNMPTDFVVDYGNYVKNCSINKSFLVSIMAKQFTDAGAGPGADVVSVTVEEGDKETEVCKTEKQIDVNTKKRVREPEEKQNEREKIPKQEKKVPKVKSLKLSEITKPLERGVKEQLLISSVERLLKCDKGGKPLHQKLLTTLAVSFSPVVRETILNHLLGDLRNYVDLALGLLFEEYSIMQGFARIPALRKGSRLDQSYNKLLCIFISAANHDAIIISRLLLEAPLITDEAMSQIKEICRDEQRSGWILGLLRDITVRKPPKQLLFLNTLLCYTTYESHIVRENAINHVLILHKLPGLSLIIEEFARMNMEFLKLDSPPDSLTGIDQGRLKSETWGDDYIKASLLLYVSLLQGNHSLIHDLAKIYTKTNADIKRIILRLIENPIRSMSMESKELLKLIEECPNGSETLVTRIIHILTEKVAPTTQMVHIVRDLYNSKVSDVRFLIPVLNGLHKHEVLSVLPKLIKLNPNVVKEVFNRLLGLHGESPVTPTDLLVALHLIDTTKADIKTVIKATSYCLQEKQVFTQEVLAVVLQQLMEQTPLPTLLMRTVIQALGSYPRLSGFVMNILQRLILKQVWKSKVVWEGFVKCCQRTMPQSFAVLMQLPAPQLVEALTMSPEIHEPLKEHLMTFSESQRAHIPAAVQDIILGGYRPPSVAPVLPPAIPAYPVENPPPMEVILQHPMGLTEPLPPGMD